MDLVAARIIVFLLVACFSYLSLRLSPDIRAPKTKEIKGTKVFLPVFLLLVIISAGAMLWVLTRHAWIVGYVVAFVMGLGTIKALEGYGPKIAGSMGGFVLVFFYAASQSVSVPAVILRDAATFISCLAIGVYFSRLVSFTNLALVAALLAVYDFAAVFVTRHMVALNVAGRHILPLIAVPYTKANGLLQLPGTGIGSGDLIIIAALIGGTEHVHGKKTAAYVAAGVLTGFAVTYLGMSALGASLAPGLPGIVGGGLGGLWVGGRHST